MFDNQPNFPPIVFLHIPKTAGQTVHNELARAVGNSGVSPIRVHTQTTSSAAQFPTGYRLYSGHVDWVALDQVPQPRFVFSVLRDPKERIASFYFYLRRQAQALSAEDLKLPNNTGKRLILEQSADDYFFGGDAAWQTFVRDHYDNFYCRYFGSGKVRAGDKFNTLPQKRKLRRAFRAISKIDWVYSISNLTALEDDMRHLYGFDLKLTETRTNASERPVSEARWPLLLDQFEKDGSRAALDRFVDLDNSLMQRLEL